MATLIGAAGVTLLLGAFALNLLRVAHADGKLYLSLNLAGASLACWSSVLIGFLPFVILEGVWALVAAVALAWPPKPPPIPPADPPRPHGMSAGS
jgi:hypothetical protein